LFPDNPQLLTSWSIL